MPDNREGSAEQNAFESSRIERDRTLEAIRRFETALAMAAEGESWLSDVTTDLDSLESAMVDEQQELHRPDALLAMIAAENPRRFKPRVRNLRERYDDIIRQVVSLRDQITHEKQVDPNDLRQRGYWITTALHHCRARQTDLVYEALNMDLGQR